MDSPGFRTEDAEDAAFSVSAAKMGQLETLPKCVKGSALDKITAR
jgi:hypothetical protein